MQYQILQPYSPQIQQQAFQFHPAEMHVELSEKIKCTKSFGAPHL